MANAGREHLIKCPYFRSEEKRRHFIRCEGIGEAEYTELNFSGTEKARQRQLSAFCADTRNCAKCEVYRMIEESKYQD